MSYPAYEGLEFYFSIPVGGVWRHEFRSVDRDAANGVVTSPDAWAGFTAKMDLTDDSGQILANLSTEPGANGTITLGDDTLGPDVVICELGSGVTTSLPPTRSLRLGATKAFVHAVLWMTDPTRPTEPYRYAVGKGVIANL